MISPSTPDVQFEVHDPAILANARAILDTCRTGREMQDAVVAAVRRSWVGVEHRRVEAVAR